MKSRPNLFFIGAMRCGSTSINLMLDQHKDIFMSPIKEPRFFEAEVLRSMIKDDSAKDSEYKEFISKGKHRILEAYLELFNGAEQQKYLGESSHYIYSPSTAKLIKDFSPEARILISLRDPVDRLFSEYQLFKRRGKTYKNFKSFLNENAKVQQGKLYEKEGGRLNKGFYYDRLKVFLDVFGKENVKIIFFEDFSRDGKVVMNEVFSWLGLEMNQISEVHTQKSGAIKQNPIFRFLLNNRSLKRMLRRFVPKLLKEKIRSKVYDVALEKEEMDDKSRELLKQYYAKDRQMLIQNLGLDLSKWQ